MCSIYSGWSSSLRPHRCWTQVRACVSSSQVHRREANASPARVLRSLVSLVSLVVFHKARLAPFHSCSRTCLLDSDTPKLRHPSLFHSTPGASRPFVTRTASSACLSGCSSACSRRRNGGDEAAARDTTPASNTAARAAAVAAASMRVPLLLPALPAPPSPPPPPLAHPLPRLLSDTIPASSRARRGHCGQRWRCARRRVADPTSPRQQNRHMASCRRSGLARKNDQHASRGLPRLRPPFPPLPPGLPSSPVPPVRELDWAAAGTVA